MHPPPEPNDDPSVNTITAYAKGPDHAWRIEPAPATRPWMDRTQQKFAYKCLPLVMANQAGWVIVPPTSVKATWRGGDAMNDMIITHPDDAPDHYKNQVVGTFGHAIVSFVIPWVFRTPPGVGLWVRGIPNRTIPGAAPLEGIVETDWATQPFTMNWRILEPHRTITFPANEPIALIAPYPLDLAESLEPERKRITEDPQIADEFRRFHEERRRRHEQNRARAQSGKTVYARDHWKLDYMKGRTTTGAKTETHRTNFKLKKFPSTTHPPR